MKNRALLRACLVSILRRPLIGAVHTLACMAVLLFLVLLGRGSGSDRMEAGNIGSAVMNCAAGMPALLGAVTVHRAMDSGVVSRLAASPVSPLNAACALLEALVPAGLAETALVFGFSLLLGAPFAPGMLLSLAAALPEIVFFACFGVCAGCVLSYGAAGTLCGLGVSFFGVWLSHLIIDPSALPSPLAGAVSLTPHAAYTGLIHAFFCPGASPAPQTAALCIVYTALAAAAALLGVRRALKKGKTTFL